MASKFIEESRSRLFCEAQKIGEYFSPERIEAKDLRKMIDALPQENKTPEFLDPYNYIFEILDDIRDLLMPYLKMDFNDFLKATKKPKFTVDIRRFLFDPDLLTILSLETSTLRNSVKSAQAVSKVAYEIAQKLWMISLPDDELGKVLSEIFARQKASGKIH